MCIRDRGSIDGAQETITLTLVNDALVEGDETVDLQLGTPVGDAELGMITDHVATIVDSDTASVEFEMAVLDTAEIDGAATINVALTATGPSGDATLASALTVDFADLGTGDATADVDYATIVGGTLTFDVGATNNDVQSLTVDVIADLDSEVDELIDLELTNPSAPLTLGGNAVAALTILDDDHLITGNGQNVFTVDQIDPSSALTAGSSFGFSGTDDPEGSAYDPVNNVLYLSADFAEDALFRYDPVTKTVTLVGQYAIRNVSPAVEALAFDPNTMTLYGVDDSSNTLLDIDTTTGRATPIGGVGALGTSEIESLAFDPNANVLYGANDAANELVTLDTVAGTFAVVGPVSYTHLTLPTIYSV